MLKKLPALLLVVAILATFVPACSPNPSSNSSPSSSEKSVPTTVTVLLPSYDEIKDTSVIKKFEDSSGINVEFNYVGWDQIENKVTIAAAAQTAVADIHDVDWSWVGDFAQIGCMEPLTISEEDKKDIPTLVDFTVDGKVLSMPISNDYRLMNYNTAAFAKAGITSAPATWDDIINDAKILKAKGVVEYPFQVPLSISEGSTTAFMLITLSRSGPIFNDDNTIDRGNVLSTFNLYNQLLNVDKVFDPSDKSMIDQELGKAYQLGKYSITPTGPGGDSVYNDPKQSSIVNQNMMFLMPGNSGKKSVTLGLPESVGISAYSKNKDAALKVLNWYLSADIQEYNSSIGMLPTRTSVLTKLYGDNATPAQKVILDQSQYIVSPFPKGIPTWYPQFSTALQNAINEMCAGTISADQATSIVASTVDGLIKAARQQ